VAILAVEVPNQATAPEVALLFLRVNTTRVFCGEVSGKSLSRFLSEKKAKRMEDFLLEPSLLSIQAIVILDCDGERLLAKYYDRTRFPNIKEQQKFEKRLHKKTAKKVLQ